MPALEESQQITTMMKASAQHQPILESEKMGKTIEELTLQQRCELRQVRFGNGKETIITGMKEATTTVEALQFMEEQKRRQLERAERFGIVTKEMNEMRIKERQARFGIETKESIEAKK